MCLCMMYMVQDQVIWGFSETTDFVTFKNIGRFNEGVMKATNFKSPKHGAVTYLTKPEMKAIVENWKMDFKVDD